MHAEQLNGHLDALLLAALEDDPRHGRRHRCYALTAAGGRALPGHRAEWRDFAAVIGAALEGKPWPSTA
jgi:DNA-binding PadR family transcriptional regulator